VRRDFHATSFAIEFSLPSHLESPKEFEAPGGVDGIRDGLERLKTPDDPVELEVAAVS